MSRFVHVAAVAAALGSLLMGCGGHPSPGDRPVTLPAVSPIEVSSISVGTVAIVAPAIATSETLVSDPSAMEAVRAAVAETLAVRRGEVRNTGRIVSLNPGAPVLETSVATTFDRDDRRGRVVVDARAVLGQLSEAPEPGGYREVVSDGVHVWTRSEAGGSWAEQPVSEQRLEELFGPGLDETLAVARLVEAPIAASALPEAGPLDGAIGFRVLIDPTTAADALSGTDRELFRQLLPTFGGAAARVSVDVWLTAGGPLRRLAFPQPQTAEDGTRLEWTIDFIGLGQPVDIALPGA